MTQHREAEAFNLQCLQIERPFSIFDFVEEQFGGEESIRRIFSLARSLGSKTLLVEDIPAIGEIAEENEDIHVFAADHRMDGLKRLSFWKDTFKRPRSVQSRKNDHLLGFAIVKRDLVPSRNYDRWHVFEAVFRKYPHKHNCIPGQEDFPVAIAGKPFSVPGVMYCQQNALNKACAQVALRSLISLRLPGRNVSYRKINQIAKNNYPDYDPARGLSAPQIRDVLASFGINFRDIDYASARARDESLQKSHPYQKFIYAGIESGAGALLGFHLSEPDRGKHIIPFFGHTFNKDTWAPDADVAYFNIGGGVGYFPSESWTSSFLGHDDNFGANFCVPRLYVKPEQVDYVVELLNEGVAYSGVQAEAISLNFLYSLLPEITQESNRWVQRLARWADPDIQRAVLRAVSVLKKTYLDHLRTAADWEEQTEDGNLCDVLDKLLPNTLWVVEVSLPQLFPANERKLGEIVLNASIAPTTKAIEDFNLFLLARIPGQLFFVESVNSGRPNFLRVPSKITSHLPLLRLEN